MISWLVSRALYCIYLNGLTYMPFLYVGWTRTLPVGWPPALLVQREVLFMGWTPFLPVGWTPVVLLRRGTQFCFNGIDLNFACIVLNLNFAGFPVSYACVVWISMFLRGNCFLALWYLKSISSFVCIPVYKDRFNSMTGLGILCVLWHFDVSDLNKGWESCLW